MERWTRREQPEGWASGKCSNPGHTVVALCAKGPAVPVPEVERRFGRRRIVTRRGGT